MSLHVHLSGSGPRLGLLHGFTQTSVSWRPVADLLVPDHLISALDLPGHGRSHDVVADLTTTADLVSQALEPGVLVGYSMGGRVALRVALDHPSSVRGLILIGATAGIEDPMERAERRRADHALADRIESIGTERFLDEWTRLPLFAGLRLADDDRAARAANPAAGLASSLRCSGTGTMDPPWWDQLGRIRVPVLVMAGELDARFTALGGRLVDAIGPNAHLSVVAGCGHAAHLEDPRAVASAIRHFVHGPVSGDRR